ncbi:uncharacterized protein LOC115879025 [Sitophilus oryzae]|uniref:Uncharacterized protein LOC115879025 n=1 Tax=Sitophilus oryzae TaxID=7048 RepID=A0A6J2XJ61_SITOR|nr:uncharacterized protein LOC115879025 [Sitophilus oryzae]
MTHVTLYYTCAVMVSMLIPILAECPRLCECKWKSGKESVVCLNANLTVVPLHLDSGTQILDLTGNGIVTLRNEEFSKAGLLNLQKIYLAKCKLKTIERFTFKNLINLVELDLSYNVLSFVPSHAFDTIPEIRELKLNGNPIQKIANSAFSSTHDLIRLELSHCRINFIEQGAFLEQADKLEWLKLDSNRLTEIDVSVLQRLRNLHGLELAGNPWNCSCKLLNLREWMIRRNVPYDIPPTCQYPKRIFQRSWRVLELDEFACAPKIVPTEHKAKGVEGRNVTLTCNIDGVPNPTIKWSFRNRVIANLSGVAQWSGKKMYILNLRNNSSELTIYSAEMHDAGLYTCSAENKAGKSEAMVTLTMGKKIQESTISDKTLVVSVLLGLTVTFLCCAVAVYFASVRKKRILNWHSNECRRDDNYEKIEMKERASRNVNGGVARDGTGLVAVSRKNGDYSVVPGTDTDHEVDEEEESTLEITTPGTSADKRSNNGADSNRVNKAACTVEADNDNTRESRDNIKRTYNSTFGTYKISPAPSASVRLSPPSLSATYTATTSRQVPDVIGHSPFRNVSSRTQSERGSASDINELFCTLPRKRDLPKYRSSDSQSLLLPESRYGSESGSSSDSFARRMSIETRRFHDSNLTKHRGNRTSGGSLLNLSRDERCIDPTSTPLLDVKSLETRMRRKPSQSEFASPGNPYDCHAAQLEKFLEEYRVLQKQLTKMKETCDSLCQERTRGDESIVASSSANTGANLNNRIILPNTNQSIQDSVEFKHFENQLTKYLMTRSLSTRNFSSDILHN